MISIENFFKGLTKIVKDIKVEESEEHFNIIGRE